MQLQKRFFDHYLKGERNGWKREPRVWLNLRRPFTDEVELRKESEWPLRGTKWTKLHLDAGGTGKLDWTAPQSSRAKTLRAATPRLPLVSPPTNGETQHHRPLAAELH